MSRGSRNLASAVMVAGLLCAGCSSAGHELRLTPGSVAGLCASPVVVPMTLAYGLPMVEVELNGRGPYQMVIDTGCSGLMLSPRVEADAGLRPESCQMTFLEGSKRWVETVRWARIDAARIGGVEFAGFDAVVWDMDRLSAATGARIDGIIGASLISECVWTLDYPAQRVVLSGAGPAGVLQQNDGVPLHTMAAAPGRTVWTVEAHCGQATLELMLDTGMTAAIALTTADVESLRNAGVEIEEEGLAERYGLLGSSPHSVHRIGPPVRVGDLELRDHEVMESVSWSRIGSGAFADCRLELNLSGGWARIERVK